MELLPIVKGLATYAIPPQSRIRKLIATQAPQGGSRSAQYCYGVWLKHLCLLAKCGYIANRGNVAEFGPGDTLGAGIAALLSGASGYRAFDVVPFASPQSNLEVLRELIELFRQRAPRPKRGWPDFDFLLDGRLFPSSILSPQTLDSALEPNRLDALHAAIHSLAERQSDLIRYVAPWDANADAERGSIDLIFSQSVLQYIPDLNSFYATCRSWLKPKGWMSHHIDLSSMKVTRIWNGHWKYPPWLWSAVRGDRPFFLTGRTYSEHLSAIQRNGFRIRHVARYRLEGVSRRSLARARRRMTETDLHCANVFVVAQKT
ncbi:MAG TPA: methyltransferase domain-containing protein [Steroidobacteraceae bacterium]|nr:methyltransferase domain-containing protein [Steroidobacteraceae bacterium]